MNKSTLILLALFPLHITAVSSTMAHRTLSTAPLLYKMIDYRQQEEKSLEVMPLFSTMYDSQQAINRIIPQGLQTLHLSQQGNGDFNPLWIGLQSVNDEANYESYVTFKPKFIQAGVALHAYKFCNNFFVDVKSALVQSKTEIKITEVGGGNGAAQGLRDAQQAFSQDAWNYGKFGEPVYVVGLDDIQLQCGGTRQLFKNMPFKMFATGFGLVQAPTGSGTKSEWLFEPQVGTNHWGLGCGTEIVISHNNMLFMIGGNYRYVTPNWETRSFDLKKNGPWSRYLLLQQVYGLPYAPQTEGLPGINFLTQQAYIKGRNEINMYTRLATTISKCAFEVSYNYYYKQRETITDINPVLPVFGVYTLNGPAGGSGGVSTSSTGHISQAVTETDPIDNPVTISVNDFNKRSAESGSYSTNTLTIRVDKVDNDFIYGCGANIEVAQSESAISTWSIWAKFEILFGKSYSPDNDDFLLSFERFETYDDNFNALYDIDEDLSLDDEEDALEDEKIQKELQVLHDDFEFISEGFLEFDDEDEDAEDEDAEDEDATNIEEFVPEDQEPSRVIEESVADLLAQGATADLENHQDILTEANEGLSLPTQEETIADSNNVDEIMEIKTTSELQITDTSTDINTPINQTATKQELEQDAPSTITIENNQETQPLIVTPQNTDTAQINLQTQPTLATPVAEQTISIESLINNTQEKTIPIETKDSTDINGNEKDLIATQTIDLSTPEAIQALPMLSIPNATSNLTPEDQENDEEQKSNSQATDLQDTTTSPSVKNEEKPVAEEEEEEEEEIQSSVQESDTNMNSSQEKLEESDTKDEITPENEVSSQGSETITVDLPKTEEAVKSAGFTIESSQAQPMSPEDIALFERKTPAKVLTEEEMLKVLDSRN